MARGGRRMEPYIIMQISWLIWGCWLADWLAWPLAFLSDRRGRRRRRRRRLGSQDGPPGALRRPPSRRTN